MLIDQAPLNSEIYCGLDELWKVTRRLAEIITGDATYFDIPSHTVQTLLKPNMPERTLILRTWE